MKSPTTRTEMSQDVRRLVERWKRAGYDWEDMPHELLVYAMAIIMDQEYSRERVLERLELLIQHVHNAKEKVVVDWAIMVESKRPVVRRIINDDQHPRLFPDRY